MIIRAGIDVGTNAVKGCLARVGDGRLEILREWRVVTRLGQGWSAGGRLRPAPMGRACTAVCAIVDEALRLGAEQVRVAGTSACREASNASELAACILDACGSRLEILSGEEEAALSYLAASRLEAVSGPTAVFDSGGGSTEWAAGEDGRMNWATSVPLGAVRLTQESLIGDPASEGEIEAASRRISETLSAVPDIPAGTLLATGGAAHTMARVHGERFGLDRDAARRLTCEEVERQVALYSGMTTAARAKTPGMEAARADIILAGALIVRGCLKAARADEALVTDAGLRHGLVAAAA